MTMETHKSAWSKWIQCTCLGASTQTISVSFHQLVSFLQISSQFRFFENLHFVKPSESNHFFNPAIQAFHLLFVISVYCLIDLLLIIVNEWFPLQLDWSLLSLSVRIVHVVYGE